jgi:hypothetical protein
VKDKLVKVCLALKNGFHVPPGEIMELYRKSLAIKLNKDKSLKAYFKVSFHSSSLLRVIFFFYRYFFNFQRDICICRSKKSRFSS